MLLSDHFEQFLEVRLRRGIGHVPAGHAESLLSRRLKEPSLAVGEIRMPVDGDAPETPVRRIQRRDPLAVLVRGGRRPAVSAISST